MKKLYLLLLFGILFLSFAHAQSYKQGSTIQITSVCDNCSSVNLTQVTFPNGSIALQGSYPMTKNGTMVNFTILNNGSYINTIGLNNTFAQLGASNTFGAFNQTFDTNAFFIDSNNNRVGLGTTTPSTTLTVAGNTNVTTGNISINSGNKVCLNYGCTQWMMANTTGVFIQG